MKGTPFHVTTVKIASNCFKNLYRGMFTLKSCREVTDRQTHVFETI